MNNRKSILCLFLLFLLSLGSLSVNAQTVSKVFKEQTLKTVLKEIESQTGLSIIYQKNEINENKKVNATFENTPVVEALSSILDKSLEVNLKNKMIVISLKKLMPGDDKTKVRSINGKILDENGEPFTAHTTNPVPFMLINGQGKYELKDTGALCDVAPTILQLLGIKQPAEMTGQSLIK